MKLYLLRPVKDLPKDDNPWGWAFDPVFGFVIRAESEFGARCWANENKSDEGEDINHREDAFNNPWLYAKYSTCVELLPEGDEGIVLMDLRSEYQRGADEEFSIPPKWKPSDTISLCSGEAGDVFKLVLMDSKERGDE